MLGHAGVNKTLGYIRRWFWWPNKAKDMEDFCISCRKCQMSKGSCQKRPGWLHTMPIPAKPWKSIGMDFSGPYPEVQGYDYILVVICRMTNMVHLIPTQTDATARDIAELYVKEVVRLHGLPESIVSDRDAKFTSIFWTELSKMLGQRLLMSSSYHPQTDGSSERAIQTMSQAMRMLVNDYQSNWPDQLPLVEFAMNSAINESTGYAPFELNYGWMPKLIGGLDFESPREGVKQFVKNIRNVLDRTFDKLVTQRTCQAVKANRHCREGQKFNVGDLILLSTENLSLPKGRARKLLPKYLGPYKVLTANHSGSACRVELPPDLKVQRIHDIFHEKVLKSYVENDIKRFPKRETRIQYDVGNDPDQEWVIHSIEDHKWSPGLTFRVRWELGDATWEPLDIVKDLEALDQYLELKGVMRPSDLWRK
jgi:hypothetical protein